MAELKEPLKNFSVVFLSAGRGYRLGKVGKKKPKCLININGKTIILRLVEILTLKGLKELNIILGYKHKMILKELKKIKSIKINYIKMRDYINTGSVYSLYNFKKLWLKHQKQKPILMFHTDIIFDQRYLENIILSKHKNLIGVKNSNTKSISPNKFVVKASKSMRIEKIGRHINCKPAFGEVLCINKFSVFMFKKLLIFLKEYFKEKTNNVTWEYPLSEFSKRNHLYVLKNQNYKWVNVNTIKDLNIAKKLFL